MTSSTNANGDGKYTKGQIYDTRCFVTPRNTLVVDYELEDRLTSPDRTWTGFILLKVEKPQALPDSPMNIVTRQNHCEEVQVDDTSEIDFLKKTKHQFGNVLKWDSIEIDILSDAFIFWENSTNSVKRFHLLVDNVQLPYDRWFVLTFQIIPDTPIVFYVNETKIDLRNPENKCPTMKTNPDNVSLGDSQFEGYVARFALYNRTLLEDEIKCIVWEFLNPRIVGMQLCRGHFYDNLRLIYSDCSAKSYGGKVNQYFFHPLWLEDDDYITSISILNLRSSNYRVRVRTKNKEEEWESKLQRTKDQEVQDQEVEDQWTTFQCEKDQEIVDLQVSYENGNRYFGRWDVTGITVLDVCTDSAKILCRRQLREFYLQRLREIPDKTAESANTGYELAKPDINCWDYNAKIKWREYQRKVLQEPKRFLKTYLIDPGCLHISPSSVVLSASYKYKTTTNYINRDDTNEQPLWKNRPVALKFVVEYKVLEEEILGRKALQSSSENVVPIIAIALTFRPAFIKGAEDAFENKIVQVHKDSNLQGEIDAVLAHESRRHNQLLNTQTSGISYKEKYKYCIVTELGERTLFEAIKHENFAGKDWSLIRHILECVCKALHNFHLAGYIHGNVKPLNIVRVGERWKLLDMELLTRINDEFGHKQPSNGYCPPEYADAVLNPKLESPVTGTSPKICYVATVAHDLWSVGCVLYHLIFGRPLFTIDINDNMSINDLSKVCYWSETDCNRKLGEIEHDRSKKEFVAGKKLLRMLLHPSPIERTRFFIRGEEMLDVLDKPFFRAEGLNQQDLHDFENNLILRLDRIDETLKVHFNLISLVLKEVTSTVPSLVLFLPDETNCDRSVFFSPEKWFNDTIILYFVDPISLMVAPTNDKKGFTIKFPKNWVKRALPWINVALTALKYAAIAGRLSGIPIPDIATDALKFTDGLMNHFSKMAEDLKRDAANLTEDEALALELFSEGQTICGRYVDSVLENTAPLEGKSFDKKFNSILQDVIKEFVDLLPEKWIEKCGLIFVASEKDGGSNWVLEQYVSYYRKYGDAALRKKTNDASSNVIAPQFAATATSTTAVVHAERTKSNDASSNVISPQHAATATSKPSVLHEKRMPNPSISQNGEDKCCGCQIV